MKADIEMTVTVKRREVRDLKVDIWVARCHNGIAWLFVFATMSWPYPLVGLPRPTPAEQAHGMACAVFWLVLALRCELRIRAARGGAPRG